MAKIRSKNTKPELVVRRFLYANGLRFRIYYPIHGKPDIVLPSKKIAIFVHGCFWHHHGCKNDHIPKSNTIYWQQKIKRNTLRDISIREKLTQDGWKVLIVWECELDNLPKLLVQIKKSS